MTEIPIHGTCDARFARVRDAFAENFSARGDLGAGVTFELDGKRVVDLVGGHVDKEKTKEWQEDTLVNVYSVTKGWAAACVHRLVDQGKVRLDETVAHYWPEFSAANKGQIRVVDLLDHRAALPAIRESLPPEALFDWNAMTTALANEAPWWEPGTAHGYHAVTFGWLVGEVIRRASGKTAGQYFKDEIAGPLGLDAHIGLAEEDDARCATPRNMRIDPSSPPTLLARIMMDPTSVTARAFTNPPSIVNPRTVTSRAWRGMELPSANGHATARALAGFYGNLACGGPSAIVSRESVDVARKEHGRGMDLVLGVETRFGAGYMLSQPALPGEMLGPNEGSFGHPGAGGSLGFADPTARVSFGYVTCRMGTSILIDPRAAALIGAFYEALG